LYTQASTYGNPVLFFVKPLQKEESASDFLSNGYRFGFNGLEKDNEVGADIYTAEFWEYDSKIGRRWNIDPMTYAYKSLYSCFDGNPIYFADPSGADDESGGGGEASSGANTSSGGGLGSGGLPTPTPQSSGPTTRSPGTTAPSTGTSDNSGGSSIGHLIWDALKLSVRNILGKVEQIPANINKWFKNPDKTFKIESDLDIGIAEGANSKVGSLSYGTHYSLINLNIAKATIEQECNDDNPVKYNFDFIGENSVMHVSQDITYGNLLNGVSYTHSFDALLTDYGGYRNEKHLFVVTSAFVENKVTITNKQINNNIDFNVSFTAQSIIGFKISVTFGHKTKK
jgi:RHS repeat-associated protein